MKFATIEADGQSLYGIVSDAGFTALSPHFPQWATLRDVIAATLLFGFGTGG